jgi:NAD+ kinase
MSPTGHRTVAIAGRLADSRVAEAIETLSKHLRSLGHEVRVPSVAAAESVSPADWRYDESFVRGADLVVAVGGDGTMLHAARAAAIAGVPVLGVNRGRLGFLADVSPDRMIESVGDALAGRCQADPRMLLQASVRCADGPRSALALNDVAIARLETGRMLDLHTWIDGVYVNTHGGDGFIVATSTGSTAYALSCGGPIVQPSLAALVLVPICPHTLSDRPIVVAATSVVELELAEGFETRAQIVCDGVVLCELEPGARLRIERAAVAATFLHPPGHDYYRILRSKLHWGRGARVSQPPGV